MPFATRLTANLEANDAGFRFERRSSMPFNDPGVAAMTGAFFVSAIVGVRRAFVGPVRVREVPAARVARSRPQAVAAKEGVEMAEIVQLQQTLVALKAKRAGLLPSHPEYAALTDRIRKVEATLALKRKALREARKKRPQTQPNRGKLAPGARAPKRVPPQKAAPRLEPAGSQEGRLRLGEGSKESRNDDVSVPDRDRPGRARDRVWCAESGRCRAVSG